MQWLGWVCTSDVASRTSHSTDFLTSLVTLRLLCWFLLITLNSYHFECHKMQSLDLFSLKTHSLGNFIQSYGFKYHLYIDSHIYTSQLAAASPAPAWVSTHTPASCHLCPLPPRHQCTSGTASAPSQRWGADACGGPCIEVRLKPKMNPRDYARKEEGLKSLPAAA